LLAPLLLAIGALFGVRVARGRRVQLIAELSLGDAAATGGIARSAVASASRIDPGPGERRTGSTAAPSGGIAGAVLPAAPSPQDSSRAIAAQAYDGPSLIESAWRSLSLTPRAPPSA
jgi:hypothetical protein